VPGHRFRDRENLESEGVKLIWIRGGKRERHLVNQPSGVPRVEPERFAARSRRWGEGKGTASSSDLT